MNSASSSCSAPRATAAVVNYNGRHLLPVCLNSLLGQRGVELDILVVDNASSDDSVELTRRSFPSARILRNRANLGYNAALNQAFEAMTGDYLLAMNTDIRLAPDFVAQLARCIERHRAEGCGYAQGKVALMSETGEPDGRLYSTGHLICPNRIVYNRGGGQRDAGQYEREEAIPGANAACLLMAREMLEDMRSPVGPFDPLFFMYGGDVDFDWLAALRGWRAWYCPRAAAYHIGEATSQVAKRGFDADFVNSRFLTMLKNDRPLDVLLDLPRLAKRTIQDLLFFGRTNPSLFWRGPAHLLARTPAALRSRRATRHLRAHPAIAPREWMNWSLRLLRESRQYANME